MKFNLLVLSLLAASADGFAVSPSNSAAAFKNTDTSLSAARSSSLYDRPASFYDKIRERAYANDLFGIRSQGRTSSDNDTPSVSYPSRETGGKLAKYNPKREQRYSYDYEDRPRLGQRMNEYMRGDDMYNELPRLGGSRAKYERRGNERYEDRSYEYEDRSAYGGRMERYNGRRVNGQLPPRQNMYSFRDSFQSNSRSKYGGRMITRDEETRRANIRQQQTPRRYESGYGYSNRMMNGPSGYGRRMTNKDIWEEKANNRYTRRAAYKRNAYGRPYEGTMMNNRYENRERYGGYGYQSDRMDSDRNIPLNSRMLERNGLIQRAGMERVGGYSYPGVGYNYFDGPRRDNRRDINRAFGPRGRQVDGGGTRQTFHTPEGFREDMLVSLDSEGRPIDADVELWSGPNHVPQKVKTYCMDGRRNRFEGIFSGGGTVSVRNNGPVECPTYAQVEPVGKLAGAMSTRLGSATLQGSGALKTWSIQEDVGEAYVELESEGLPMKCSIEVWKGPGQVQQVAAIESEDGFNRPFKMKIDTRDLSYFGSTTIAVRNNGPLEFPVQVKVSY